MVKLSLRFEEGQYAKIFHKVRLPKVIIKQQEVYLKSRADSIINLFKKLIDYSNFTTLVNHSHYGAQRVFLVLIAYTGARRNEVATLKVEDIDLQNKCIHFRNTKNSKPRYAPVTDKILGIIKDYLIEREKNIKSKTTSLFLNKRGNPINADSIGANIIMVAKQHGIDMKFHAFRRGS